MRLAIVSQQGGKASGAEHALMEFVKLLPTDLELLWFFFEDGDFAQSIREKHGSVTIIKMSSRIARVERRNLSLSALTDALALTLRLRAALRSARPDVVLTNSMKAHLIGAVAARAAGVACVNYVHDIVEGRALALLRFTSRLCSIERLTCSHAVKKHLNLPRTTVAYAAIDTRTFAKLPDRNAARKVLGIFADDRPVVAMVGRIARWKRQDAFIDIAARVARKSDAHFYIIGSPLFGVDGEYLRELEALVARASLGDRVHFIPWQQDMRVVYAAIDVSCNCSVREPFGRTSLEALASGVPIVCFDDAGICEVFEQNRGGTHVPVDDEVAFSEAILAYLTDGTRMADASNQARRAAEPLDVRLALPVFLDAINRVCSRSGNRLDVAANDMFSRPEICGAGGDRYASDHSQSSMHCSSIVKDQEVGIT